MAAPSNEELLRAFTQGANITQVPEEVIDAIIEQESGGDPNAVSASGAQGLMQLMPATARELGVKDPFDPVENRKGGTKFINQLLKQFDGNLEQALAAFHSGPSRVKKLIKAGKFPSGLGPVGRKYAPGVLKRVRRPSQPTRAPPPGYRRC